MPDATARDSSPAHRFAVAAAEAINKARDAYRRYQNCFYIANE